MSERVFEEGQLVRHFKGDYYRVLGLATHSETKEKLVIYERVHDDTVWVRPYDMFMSEVDHEKYPDAEQKYRFEAV